MTPQSVISAQNITKTYGKGENLFSALSDVSIDIKAGETIAIVGKSGSGKSTLMHLLALLDKPTNGQISIDTTPASKLSGAQLGKLRNQKFGFVFQQFFLNASQSVLENVMLPLKIGRIGRGKRREMALQALAQVELTDKARNKARDLSGGQKQRVVIARALVNKPHVIFADEPTGNLDSATGNLIENLLFGLNKEHGITLIIVTHDADLAARCDRQVHIKDGKVVMTTRPRSKML